MIGHKKHSVIFYNRSPQRETKLILVQHSFRLLRPIEEIIIGIQRGVSEIFPNIAMKLIGSRLRYDIDICTCIAAVGCVILTDLHLEFLNRIGIRHGHATADVVLSREIVNFRPIHLKVVVIG